MRFSTNGMACANPSCMSTLNILLIEDETAHPLLGKILVTNGYSVIDIATPVANIQNLVLDNKTDLVIFNIDSPKKHFQDIEYLNQKHALPIIIFASDDTTDSINQVIKSLRRVYYQRVASRPHCRHRQYCYSPIQGATTPKN